MTHSLLKLSNVSKSFNNVKVLKSVYFELISGRIHALVGENGAGKSTLMRVISGIYAPDDGAKMLLNGKEYQPYSPKDAIDSGIAIIHQELNLLSGMSVVDNLYLGREQTNNLGFIKKGSELKAVDEALKILKVDFKATDKVGSLSIAMQQMVEIARAILFDADIIIMDEPTDALAEAETQVLFSVIRDLAKKGKAIVYISHRLGEIFSLCDDVSILRDGEMVYSGVVETLDEDKLIHHMVGREIHDQYPHEKVNLGKVRFEVKNLSAKGVNNVSFHVKAGEILGFGGLIGAGRTELAKAIYGAMKITSGSILINDEQVVINNAADAVRAGIAYVCEDRKHEGLIQSQSIGSNMTLGALKYFLTAGTFIAFENEQKAVNEYIDAFSIRATSSKAPISTLSGGNQQKVSIAKSLMAKPCIVIFDEPTRGVDVGARREIYAMMNMLKKQGMAIILLSSDMPELLGMSDRVAVMANGQITGELNRNDATQEAILALALAS